MKSTVSEWLLDDWSRGLKNGIRKAVEDPWETRIQLLDMCDADLEEEMLGKREFHKQ